MKVLIRHLCTSYTSPLRHTQILSYNRLGENTCWWHFSSALMAAIVRDDEADVRECCECFLHLFMATCVCGSVYEAQFCEI